MVGSAHSGAAQLWGLVAKARPCQCGDRWRLLAVDCLDEGIVEETQVGHFCPQDGRVGSVASSSSREAEVARAAVMPASEVMGVPLAPRGRCIGGPRPTSGSGCRTALWAWLAQLGPCGVPRFTSIVVPGCVGSALRQALADSHARVARGRILVALPIELSVGHQVTTPLAGMTACVHEVATCLTLLASQAEYRHAVVAPLAAVLLQDVLALGVGAASHANESDCGSDMGCAHPGVLSHSAPLGARGTPPSGPSCPRSGCSRCPTPR